MSRAQCILEAFNLVNVPYKTISRGSAGAMFTYEKRIGNSLYEFIFNLNAAHDLHVDFTKDDHTQKQASNQRPTFSRNTGREIVSNTGEVREFLQAISIVKSMIIQISKSHQVDSISFMTSGDKAGREKLYLRFAHELARYYNGRLKGSPSDGVFKIEIRGGNSASIGKFNPRAYDAVDDEVDARSSHDEARRAVDNYRYDIEDELRHLGVSSPDVSIRVIRNTLDIRVQGSLSIRQARNPGTVKPMVDRAVQNTTGTSVTRSAFRMTGVTDIWYRAAVRLGRENMYIQNISGYGT